MVQCRSTIGTYVDNYEILALNDRETSQITCVVEYAGEVFSKQDELHYK